jgi:hypothetical protein
LHRLFRGYLIKLILICCNNTETDSKLWKKSSKFKSETVWKYFNWFILSTLPLEVTDRIFSNWENDLSKISRRKKSSFENGKITNTSSFAIEILETPDKLLIVKSAQGTMKQVKCQLLRSFCVFQNLGVLWAVWGRFHQHYTLRFYLPSRALHSVVIVSL